MYGSIHLVDIYQRRNAFIPEVYQIDSLNGCGRTPDREEVLPQSPVRPVPPPPCRPVSPTCRPGPREENTTPPSQGREPRPWGRWTYPEQIVRPGQNSKWEF
jgi:hypothetical protein